MLTPPWGSQYVKFNETNVILEIVQKLSEKNVNSNFYVTKRSLLEKSLASRDCQHHPVFTGGKAIPHLILFCMLFERVVVDHHHGTRYESIPERFDGLFFVLVIVQINGQIGNLVDFRRI